MAFISSVEVTLWQAESIGNVLSLLHAAGWQFWEGEVRYCSYREVGEEEVVGTATPERWPEIVPQWDEQCRQGKTIQIMYQWQDQPDKQATVLFSRKDEADPSLLKLEFEMFPAWQRLCGNITDYSWYLSRIVCPLEQNECGVLWVTCSDDNA